MTYVEAFHDRDGKTAIRHLNGVPWHEAPVPRRWHHCWPQTKGTVNWFTDIERCACGAIREVGHRRWTQKNQRRRND